MQIPNSLKCAHSTLLLIVFTVIPAKKFGLGEEGPGPLFTRYWALTEQCTCNVKTFPYQRFLNEDS